MTAEYNKERIAEIEGLMQKSDFWLDKEKAQVLLKELKTLKDGTTCGYDDKEAVVTIFAGAGGDDAEDFAHMLFEMYDKYSKSKGWVLDINHINENDHGGIRNITFTLSGKKSYGILKRESGVHRLVRVSPFNAKKLRHTSFAMVEVIPKFDKINEEPVPDDEVEVEFAKSSGPGGQNVNKRETAVRVIHIPTKVSVHVDSERNQQQNRDRAMKILAGKLYKIREEEREAKEKGLYISKTTQAEWGNQIRSYVLHPYKLVKDHRTEYETHDIEGVLNGDLDEFINAERTI
jgi:peptide chain release factor 2